MNTTVSRAEPLPARQGQYVVLAMIGLAIAAAMFAWWWNYGRSQRPMELFGPEAATLIRTAPQVEILVSEPTGNIEISKARGLLNARTSLLSDASYEWSSPTHFNNAQAAVKFSQGNQSVIVFFDFENRSVQVSGTGRTATLVKKTAEGWRAYIARQIENPGK
jgi:hypothetical protein